MLFNSCVYSVNILLSYVNRLVDIMKMVLCQSRSYLRMIESDNVGSVTVSVSLIERFIHCDVILYSIAQLFFCLFVIQFFRYFQYKCGVENIIHVMYELFLEIGQREKFHVAYYRFSNFNFGGQRDKQEFSIFTPMNNFTMKKLSRIKYEDNNEYTSRPRLHERHLTGVLFEIENCQRST